MSSLSSLIMTEYEAALARFTAAMEKGEVIKHWDEGNAYRVRKLNKQRTEIWAPIDSDTLIKLDAAGPEDRAQDDE